MSTRLVTHQSDDHGLEHNHLWASAPYAGDRRADMASCRRVGADTAHLPTASSALHDDVHYGN